MPRPCDHLVRLQCRREQRLPRDAQPFYAPNARKPGRQEPQPGTLLFEFVRETDHARFRCELRVYPDVSRFEVQSLKDCDLLISHAFPTRELAVAWAAEQRRDLKQYDPL